MAVLQLRKHLLRVQWLAEFLVFLDDGFKVKLLETVVFADIQRDVVCFEVLDLIEGVDFALLLFIIVNWVKFLRGQVVTLFVEFLLFFFLIQLNPLFITRVLPL